MANVIALAVFGVRCRLCASRLAKIAAIMEERMTIHRRDFLQSTMGAAVLPATAHGAWAETYPARPVRSVVPVAPGGANDVTARLIGQWLSQRLGQQFFIENRPGAATNVGTETVIRATADGYTLLIA